MFVSGWECVCVGGRCNVFPMSAGGSGGGSSGGGGGSRFGGNGGGEMEIQEDTIFVQGLGPSITQEDLVSHFGSIGIIKVRSYCNTFMVQGLEKDNRRLELIFCSIVFSL